MYLHLNQGRWYPWKRIAKYDAFLNMISAQKSDHRSNLELQSEIDFLKQFRIFSFVGIRDQEKSQKIKIVGRDQDSYESFGPKHFPATEINYSGFDELKPIF